MAKRAIRLRKTATVAPREEDINQVALEAGLLSDVRSLIDASRRQLARVVNSALVLTYWSIGARIAREIMGDERAEYGQRVVERLSAHLAAEYGSGFSKRNLFQMVSVARTYADSQIVQTLSAQFGWSHLVTLARVEDGLQREFYERMCMTERWSVRTLQQKIDGMLFERPAISRKPPVELLELERSGIRVAEYLTELPPRELLEARLQAAVRLARERIDSRPTDEPQSQ
jgi:hypothetical protein